MKQLIKYFLQGLLYITPIGVTVYVLYFILIKLNNFSEQLFSLFIPGLGLVILLTLIILIGYLGTKLISQPITNWFNRQMNKAPLIKIIYFSVKDLLSAFVGKEKKFKNPVLVRVNKSSNLEKIGFITQTDLSNIGISEKKVTVYFPHSYAFSGELFVVPIEDITPLDVNSSEIIKFIISGGISNKTNTNNKN